MDDATNRLRVLVAEVDGIVAGPSEAPNPATSLDISYRDGLAVYWTLYWMSAVSVGGAFVFVARVFPALLSNVVGSVAIQILIYAITIFLAVPRMVMRRFQRFLLVIVPLSGDALLGLTTRRRIEITFFLCTRSVGLTLFMYLMQAPTNAFLSLFRVYIAGWINLLIAVFLAGPILIKFLVGHEFSDFRIEVATRIAPSEVS